MYGRTVEKDSYGQPQIVYESCLFGLKTKSMTPWVNSSASVDYQNTVN